MQKLNLKVTENTRSEVIYEGVIDVVKKTYRNEGIKAFYKGLTPTLIR